MRFKVNDRVAVINAISAFYGDTGYVQIIDPTNALCYRVVTDGGTGCWFTDQDLRETCRPQPKQDRKRVYIAAPLSNGDVEQNVRHACLVATTLIKIGYAPLCPHLTAYMQGPVASVSAGFDHPTWMEVDLPWVKVSDAVLRLPGVSKGADQEVECAKENGIPVFESIVDLDVYFKEKWVHPMDRPAKKTDWKTGDKFTCNCGRALCKVEVQEVDKFGSGSTVFAKSGTGYLLEQMVPVTIATDRKSIPLATGLIDYFPNALQAVAHCSYVGNEQHNPGQKVHWDRSKSTDEADALMRHFLERGKVDGDGVRHSAKVAWRSLALLEKEIEAAKA